MIKRYNLGIYPMDLWVTTTDEYPNIKNKFDFFRDIQDLREDAEPANPLDPSFGAAVTFIVREKKTRDKGLLVFINTHSADKIDWFLFDTISHESVHVADAIYQFIGGNSEEFDRGNEPYAYLAGWVAGKIGQFMIDYLKRNENE